MVRHHRRTFLERLGLGAGALLLGPSIDSFVRQAHGQTPRKRFVLMVQGNAVISATAKVF